MLPLVFGKIFRLERTTARIMGNHAIIRSSSAKEGTFAQVKDSNDSPEMTLSSNTLVNIS